MAKEEWRGDYMFSIIILIVSWTGMLWKGYQWWVVAYGIYGGGGGKRFLIYSMQE